MTFFYSFYKWNGISSHKKFVGFQNFIGIFTTDEYFSTALIFTLKYTVLFVVLVNVIAIFLAVFLDKKIRFANAMRGIFFIPYIMSLVVVGFVWKFIFGQGFTHLYEFTHWGVFNWAWLSSPNLAFFSVVFVSVWQAVGFYMVIYIAGLQSVPTELLEAATVDGAGPVKRFFKVTLPMLMPSVTICLFLALTNAFKLYDVIVSLTAAGPAGTTASITYDIYREEFQNSNYGYGSAKGLVLFLMVGIITIIQVTLSKKKEVDV
jgi:raffinose/stachyose/melibiose transport system permease protein